MNKILISLYIGAIVAANLLIARYGPPAAIFVAFTFIGLNITVRDRLHDRWVGRHLVLRMMVLINTGALVSYLVSPDAGRIGIASMLSFMASETVDSGIYQGMRKYRWVVRANASNVGASIVDSVLFPTLAFGSFLPWVVLGQFTAKALGGFVWSLVLKRISPYGTGACQHEYEPCEDHTCNCGNSYCKHCSEPLYDFGAY